MAINPTLVRRIVFTPQSSWVFAFMLTCDNLLAIQFKHRLRGLKIPGRREKIPLGVVPGVCCLYPNNGEKWFNLMLAWVSKGKYVWAFLYKKQPYTVIPAPGGPFGCKDTLIATSSVNPSAVGQAVMFTAVYTNTSGTATPEGTISWFFDGSPQGTGTTTTAANTMTSTITTSSLTAGTHVITATFADLTTGNEGFDPDSTSLTQVVGITELCCPNPIPSGLFITLAGVSVFPTSLPMTYDAAGGYWTTGVFPVGGGANEIQLACVAPHTTPGGWHLSFFCGGSEGLPRRVGTAGSCSPFHIDFAGRVLPYGPTCLLTDTASGFTVTP